MSELPDLMPALPEIFLAVAGMALLLIGVFRGDGSTRLVTYLSVASLAVAAVLVITGRPEGTVVTFNNLFILDGFASFMKLLVLIGSALALAMSIDFIERERMARMEYPVLFVFATVGMLMMISANDLLSLYIGLELQSLSLYVIAAFRRDTLRSSEAGLKYFLLGALSSGLLLYGASLVYGFAGTLSFAELADQFVGDDPVSMGVVVGLVFICAGLAFKISAVPFHMWTPDVYEGSPTPVTAFFAVAPKIAAIALFARVLVGPFHDLIAYWQQIVVVTAVLSMALGAYAAIAQTNIKRLMAYSSIGHVGFALVGLAAGTEEGVRGVILYMTIYLAMNVGTFGCILCMRVKGRMVERIDDLAGLSKTNKGMAAVLLVFMFSLAGIPPMAGFFGKLYVFLAAIEAGLYTLAVLGVLASVVAAFYYLRIVKLMYFDEPTEAFDRPVEPMMAGILTVTGVFTLLFFAFPAPILQAASRAAETLFL